MADPETLVSEDTPPEDFEPVAPIHPGRDLAEIIGELEISRSDWQRPSGFLRIP